MSNYSVRILIELIELFRNSQSGIFNHCTNELLPSCRVEDSCLVKFHIYNLLTLRIALCYLATYHFIISPTIQVLKSLSDQTKPTCRCHGVSSSCLLQTCYMRAPKMEEVTSTLKRLYRSSCKVYSNQLHGNQHAYISNCTKRAPQGKELVYLDPSPNFCYRDLARGSLGVSGRRCELDSQSPGSCSYLCCGRGRVSMQVTVEKDCNCKFVWCCFIDCQKCKHQKTVYHCK